MDLEFGMLGLEICCFGIRVWDSILGFGVWCLGFGILVFGNLGYGFWSLVFGNWISGFRVWGFRYGIWSSEFEDLNFGF